ncbi:uncharacterized SAM-binding protein YcdF (DUF218 family) [Rhodovulum iodosum]|uniref:Uncharacterized SAM-binding protein YcdF (DUF218 family) n=1 Tax=Rhodovulum iodosum TaxID=68291 RepID=A0ABV3XWI3_9RHOB|nr:YdcF family protein [Rhodovulum robiginosum]
MRVVRKLIVFAIVAFGLLVGVQRVYVETYKQAPVKRPVGAVVVLSSGPVGPQRNGRTAVRTRAGVDLYFELSNAGDTPRLVLSGGGGGQNSMAEGMKEIALDAGVPAEVILVEGRSGSTLQNALFSRQAMGDNVPGHLVIVTDRFHIPRAWASFRWAGMSDFVLVAADGEDEPVDWDNLMGEAVKWPVNIARAVAYSALSAAGWPQQELLWMIE